MQALTEALNILQIAKAPIEVRSGDGRYHCSVRFLDCGRLFKVAFAAQGGEDVEMSSLVTPGDDAAPLLRRLAEDVSARNASDALVSDR